eukprot:31304-Pelagococcus_subviridis.AAC.19
MGADDVDSKSQSPKSTTTTKIKTLAKRRKSRNQNEGNDLGTTRRIWTQRAGTRATPHVPRAPSRSSSARERTNARARHDDADIQASRDGRPSVARGEKDAAEARGRPSARARQRAILRRAPAAVAAVREHEDRVQRPRRRTKGRPEVSVLAARRGGEQEAVDVRRGRLEAGRRVDRAADRAAAREGY